MKEAGAPNGNAEEEQRAGLVERLRAFESTAWAEIYDQHHRQIWRYVYGRTGNRDTADDVAAQVFSEAVSSIHRYRDTGHPILAWLYTIARNTVSKQARRKRTETLDPYPEPSGGAPEDRIDAIVLAEALDHLTAEQREVVALRFFAGYSTREIAVAMAKGEAAIYSLEVRAIAALRRQFPPNAQD